MFTKNNIKRMLKGFPPHIAQEYGINQEKPIFISIHMKPVCNYRCKKCFIGEQKEVYGEHETICEKNIKKILKSASNAGVKVLGISGAGEPFMDKRIFTIIEEAVNYDFIIHIPTNASLLNKKIVKTLLNSNVTLVLSLDTTDPGQYAELTNTNEKMFHKALDNILMAQEVYKETKTTEISGSNKIEIYRIAIHMTVDKATIDQIEKVKKLAGPDTLFSVSPVANAGFALDNKISLERPIDTSEEISEKHIVVCYDKANDMDICGFFRYGVDINFDGQLLLDAHAMETRNTFANIRDFNYDIEDAYNYLSPIKQEFITNWIDGFCPIRSSKFQDWILCNKNINKFKQRNSQEASNELRNN